MKTQSLFAVTALILGGSLLAQSGSQTEQPKSSVARPQEVAKPPAVHDAIQRLEDSFRGLQECYDKQQAELDSLRARVETLETAKVETPEPVKAVEAPKTEPVKEVRWVRKQVSVCYGRYCQLEWRWVQE